MTSSWSLYHITVFVLTFVSYAFFHATRKTFSNVKATISQEWTPAPDLLYNDTFHNGTIHQRTLPDKIWNSHNFYDNKNDAEYFLGDLDTAFLIAYAVGLFISGIVGDRLNMRLVLSFGMCSSAVAVFLFGTLSEWLHLYSKEYYLAMWIVNGLLQSTGWPTVVAIMANWFGKSSRGVVLGLWSACASVGNIIGAFIVAGVLQYGYEYAFLVPSIVLFAGGIVVFFGLVASPKEVGLPEPDENVIVTNNIINQSGQPTERDPLLQGSRRNESITEVDEVSNEPETSPEPKAIGFFQAFLLPGVILYSSSYACLKMVNYAFFFWLPYYLTNQFGWSQARSDELSIWRDYRRFCIR
ncbi:unnamed protein product [Owenia fusiformis]|uniref:Major facilitator superfamily (MFS) profile domain-containing protein n=1 Tax=Owenia fusiformis TaxID=6347 RepID=A0A8S4NQ04_OWEFU|nr:unnamed protein product [Owenia fusiformis]